MKKFLLLIMLMTSFQVANAQKKTQSRSQTAFIFEVDAIKNIDNGEVENTPCRVTKQAGKIILKSDEGTLVFTITRTVWKSKTYVEYYVSRGNVDAKWVFKEVDGQEKIALFTENSSTEMHVIDSYTQKL